MNNTISNKTILSDIAGGFAIMPNALLGFISDKACAVFLKIYQCQFVSDCEKYDGEMWAKLSTPCLAAALERSKNTVVMALEELIGLGFIKSRSENRKNTFYAINWEEILFVCNVLCKVNRKGRKELHKLCVRSKFDPNNTTFGQNLTEPTNVESKFDRMSAIDQNIINNIVIQYPATSMFGQNLTETSTVGSNFDPIINIRSNFDRKNNGSVNFRPNMELCDEPMLFQSKYDPTSDDDNVTFGQNLTEKTNVRSNFDPTEAMFGQILTTEIYNKENNKKKLRERSSQYKGDKEKNFLNYFSSRNLSFPAFDKTFCESFLEQDIDESDDDVIKSIKTVWGQLGYDEELPDNNFIDLATFQSILFHSWEQLKLDYPDYSLSEDDMKNIFGFIVIEHEGEDCLYIDPSKLQDISAPSPQLVQEKPSKNFKHSDRASRRLFIDCINEIAEEDDRLLTSSEFVALLLIDYAHEHATGTFSTELSKIAYEELLKKFSEDSNVPVADIRTLFKDLPQKHKVKISPQQLLPDKFFQYNAERGETSKVEDLFREKLENAEAGL